ncbi:T9SS C-terminal target domain-containing protein [Flavobacteriaceae bacterium AU392]|nr:T9SS C-terminal target domain-containing protein [Flavobacteriaceae bacterium]RKM84810.1 T9SS C-terminal target domain-containing protein [Flavobacteriaceae bacterium AU392]
MFKIMKSFYNVTPLTRIKKNSNQLLKHNYKFKLLVVFFLFINFYLVGQTVNTTLATEIEDRFSLLEKNRIPHNILLDYGIEFIDISKYDGVLRNDNHTSKSMYLETYNTIVSSCTVLGTPGIVAPIAENDEWQTLQKQQNDTNKGSATAPLILSGLYFNYSKIRSDALATNKIQIVSGGGGFPIEDDEFPDLNDPSFPIIIGGGISRYDDKYIFGQWQNPYETKTVFAITTPTQTIHRSSVSVSLPTTLWHTNASITNIEVDLGNGTGYKTLNNGASANATYTSAGTYIWTYRVRLSNGQYKYSRQNINITASQSQVLQSIQGANSTCGVQLQNIIATRAFSGQLGTATLQIAYSNNQCELRKPLIVAEGFDTELMADRGRIGDTDIQTFFNSVNNSGGDQLRNLITNNTTEAYDIVYVNWDNGTDFIQRNAFVLQAVINWVNANKVTNTPNVVLGQSMGGLVARYALRDMENRSESHDTGLYISHDAPHQGANVPIGALYMSRHLVDQVIGTPLNFVIDLASGGMSANTIRDLLDAPATRQLLINNVNSNFAVDNSLHNAWQNELRTLGYPQQTRNIAISNASHCAAPQEISAGERLFTLDGFGRTSFLGGLALSFTGLGAFAAILTSVLFDEAGFLIGILPGGSRFNLDFRINAYPSSGTNQSYFGKISIRKTLLFLIPINITITERSFNSPSNTLPFDSFPGGVNTALQDFENIDVFESGILGRLGLTVDLNPNFDFIPAASALDVGSNSTALNGNDYNEIYTAANPPTGNKAIPFDNFTTSFNTSTINERHITFNRLNGDWLAEELDTDPTIEVFDCSFICSNTGISGPDEVCNNASFSVANGASFYNWVITEGSSIATISGNGTPNITLNQTGSNAGYVTLSLVFGDNGAKCGNIAVTKRVFVGQRFVDNISFANGIGEEGYFCTSHNGNTYDIYPKIANVNYQYRLLRFPSLNVVYTSSPFVSDSGEITFIPSPGYYVFEARITNSCGTSDWFGFEVEYLDCSVGGGFGDEEGFDFAVFPNPGSFEFNIAEIDGESNNITNTQSINTLNVSSIQNTSFSINTNGSDNKKNNKKETKDITQIKIYDFTGNVIKQKQTGNLKNVNIQNLKDGIYFLQIITGDTEEIHRVIVKK